MLKHQISLIQVWWQRSLLPRSTMLGLTLIDYSLISKKRTPSEGRPRTKKTPLRRNLRIWRPNRCNCCRKQRIKQLIPHPLQIHNYHWAFRNIWKALKQFRNQNQISSRPRNLIYRKYAMNRRTMDLMIWVNKSWKLSFRHLRILKARIHWSWSRNRRMTSTWSTVHQFKVKIWYLKNGLPSWFLVKVVHSPKPPQLALSLSTKSTKEATETTRAAPASSPNFQWRINILEVDLWTPAESVRWSSPPGIIRTWKKAIQNNQT